MTNYQFKMKLLDENFRLRNNWLLCRQNFGVASLSATNNLELYRQSCKLLTRENFGYYYQFSASVEDNQKVFYIYRKTPIKRLDQVRENLSAKLGCGAWPSQELSMVRF